MKKKLFSSFSFDTAYKIASTFCLVAILWLNSHYITVERYVQDKATIDQRIDVVNKTLNEIALVLTQIQQQENELKDHEARIRALEQKAH